eukprot:m.14872 g.14872  ORF g.14872 m.14872 type:complete len:142 (+) comp6530_c0_seq1:133-558(+)
MAWTPLSLLLLFAAFPCLQAVTPHPCNTGFVITCAGPQSFNTFPGLCLANNTYSRPATNLTNACLNHVSQPIVFWNFPWGFEFEVGSTDQTWGVRNQITNVERQCTVTVTVTDNEAPAICALLSFFFSFLSSVCVLRMLLA